MSDHLDDLDELDPPRDGIECAFVVDPHMAAEHRVDTHPDLSLFGRFLFDKLLQCRIDGASEPVRLRVDDGTGYVLLTGTDG